MPTKRKVVETAACVAEKTPTFDELTQKPDALTHWRVLVEGVANGKPQPKASLIEDLFSHLKTLGDPATVFASDVRDWQIVAKGERQQTTAYETFKEEHGNRQDIAKQVSALEDQVRELKKLLRQHDSLEMSHNLIKVQPQQVRKQNKRLFG